MASGLSPGRSFLALLRKQIAGLDDGLLSAEAKRCVASYARHLEGLHLDRTGDHLVAGLLLNALEIVAYLPSGKLGKGSVELTRLQERVERVLSLARRMEKRSRVGRPRKDGERWAGVAMKTPPTRAAERPEPEDAEEPAPVREGFGTLPGRGAGIATGKTNGTDDAA